MIKKLRELATPAINALRANKIISDWDNELKKNHTYVTGKKGNHQSPARLLIVSSDTYTLNGARGDDAMMASVATALKKRYPELEIYVTTETDQASQIAKEIGYQPLQAWGFAIPKLFESVIAIKPTWVAVLGADIMDGYYNPNRVLKILALCDLAARSGSKVTILGFSFNKVPHKLLKPAYFERLHESVALNLRDRRSYERFLAFTKAPCNLVADTAFLLSPAAPSNNTHLVEEWISRSKASGKKVIGFNVHPMLVKTSMENQTLITESVKAISHAVKNLDVNVLLIPHDFRNERADGVCLEPIYTQLQSTLGDRIFYSDAPLSAAEIKLIASQTNGVLTGRMHLAIATLGAGVPVASITYQDKFEGLFEHFNIRDGVALSPVEACLPGTLTQFFSTFISNLDILAEKVNLNLPAVKALAKININSLVNESIKHS